MRGPATLQNPVHARLYYNIQSLKFSKHFQRL